MLPHTLKTPLSEKARTPHYYGKPGNLSGSSPGGVSPRMSAQVPSKPPYEPSLDAGLGGAAGSVM